MILRYGNYRHDFGETSTTITRTPLNSSLGTLYAIRHRWDVTGILHGETAAEVAANIAALELAYNAHEKDVYLYADSDSTVIAHRLISEATIDGTRIVQAPSYPRPDEIFSLQRTFTLSLEGDMPIAPQTSDQSGAGSGEINFSETFETSGGGPIMEHVILLRGKPRRQILCEATPYMLVQSGSCTSIRGHVVNKPLFPNDMVVSPRITMQTPRLARSGGALEYTATWQYQFESPNPMNVIPKKRR
jgi:hypothetical protein